MKTIIHVNQHIIRANKKHGTNNPPLTIRTYKETIHAHEIEVSGKVRFIHSPDKPLKCGARVWVETEDEIKIIR